MAKAFVLPTMPMLREGMKRGKECGKGQGMSGIVDCKLLYLSRCEEPCDINHRSKFSFRKEFRLVHALHPSISDCSGNQIAIASISN